MSVDREKIHRPIRLLARALMPGSFSPIFDKNKRQQPSSVGKGKGKVDENDGDEFRKEQKNCEDDEVRRTDYTNDSVSVMDLPLVEQQTRRNKRQDESCCLSDNTTTIGNDNNHSFFHKSMTSTGVSLESLSETTMILDVSTDGSNKESSATTNGRSLCSSSPASFVTCTQNNDTDSAKSIEEEKSSP